MLFDYYATKEVMSRINQKSADLRKDNKLLFWREIIKNMTSRQSSLKTLKSVINIRCMASFSQLTATN